MVYLKFWIKAEAFEELKTGRAIAMRKNNSNTTLYALGKF